MIIGGSQTRIIEICCGWRCIGHPNEVNKKLARHQRYCPSCSQRPTIMLGSFNKEAGRMNGLNALKGQKPTMEYNNFSNRLANINQFPEQIETIPTVPEFLEQIETIPTVPQLSKSQKKRQKEKAKKQRNNEKE
jgi:hypothetical protein